jgi:SAM-dependent methyltransferase
VERSSPPLYSERAELYDVVYQWKDYAGQAARLVSLLREHGIGPGARLLEAACGTGNYLAELRADHQVAGFDLSEEMIAVARRKLPEVPLWTADMLTVEPEQVDGPYDAVLCLFSSIAYLWPLRRLEEGLRRLAALVRPGGVVVIELWVLPEQWKEGQPTLQTAGLPELDAPVVDLYVARAGVATSREQDGMLLSVMDLHYLVARRDQPVEHFVERHELWLCPTETMLAAVAAAGLQPHWFESGPMSGRGLIVAIAPPA